MDNTKVVISEIREGLDKLEKLTDGIIIDNKTFSELVNVLAVGVGAGTVEEKFFDKILAIGQNSEMKKGLDKLVEAINNAAPKEQPITIEFPHPAARSIMNEKRIKNVMETAKKEEKKEQLPETGEIKDAFNWLEHVIKNDPAKLAEMGIHVMRLPFDEILQHMDKPGSMDHGVKEKLESTTLEREIKKAHCAHCRKPNCPSRIV